METNVIHPLELFSIDATTITANYQLIHPGFEYPAIMLNFVNTGDVSFKLSYDGVHGNDVILATSHFDLNGQTNSLLPGEISAWRKGTQIYIKYILGAAKGGRIYCTGYHIYQ